MKITVKEDILLKLYGSAQEAEKQAERYKKLLQEYSKRYGTPEDSNSIRLFSSPGRTEICGNHTDHNLGKVLAASIHLDCIGAVEPADDTITVHDITYNEDFSIDIKDTSRKAGETGSAALIRGMLQALKEKGLKTGGFKACFQSDVIAAAGVSSSASFEMMIGTIINHLYNDGKLPVSVLASAGQYAENKYWDKGSGLLDQTACATGGMVTIDFENPVNPAVKKLNFNFTAQGYTMMIVNTGKSHADLSAEYSSIPNEMKSVAAVLGQKTLRGLTFEDICAKLPLIREKCGDRAALRAFHFFEENDRVDVMAKALENNDFATFLKIIIESGNSSWKWLQNICVPNHADEQPVAVCLALTEHFIKTRIPGKAACRIHGGGFAGVIQAFIPSEYESEYRDYMEKALGWTPAAGTKIPVYSMRIRPLGSLELNTAV
ncbi:MAG: galactokinase [Treponemataceae bacterium]|nr:galactokinase [Treponemataceae bacterium]